LERYEKGLSMNSAVFSIDLLYWYWLILGVLFFALEIFVPGAIFMWFGFGALITGGLLFLFPDMGQGWQVLIFAILSGASIIAWRSSPFFKEESTPSDSPDLNNRLNAHIGKEYVLTEAIENGRGTVRVGDSSWRVEGENMPTGTLVRVKAIDGIIFVVEKA
jgi:membrane protein implicated in regulation of membrane protease activity